MMSGLRILYVINSMEGGGAASPLSDLIGVMQEAGAQVRLLALTARNGKAIPALHHAGIDLHVRPGGEKDHWAALRWIEQEARAFSADCLWTSLTRATLLGQIAGKRLGLPVVSWQHNAFLKPWNERLLRWNAGRSDIWVADSEQVARLTSQRLGVPSSKLVTWPIFFADPAMPQAQPWDGIQPLRLGSLGRLHDAKGYDLLIHALATLRQDGFVPPVPFTIDIAGEGNALARLEAMKTAAGIDNLHFRGFATDPRAFLASLHLYLQPSRREGFCIAAHEAMAAGLPVLVSATGEMPYTVDDGRMGRVVPVGDVPALADALKSLLSNPTGWTGMARAARDKVQNRFSRETFAAIGRDIITRATTLSERRN